jgi:LDH2 family malate/lactate/ureidoglycolate dehydrogenase
MEKLVSVEKIYNLMQDVFVKLGVPKDDAKICADVLIASDLRGIRSHGIGRLKMYYDRIRDGIQNPITNIKVIKDFNAIAGLDGNNGMGQVVSYNAMQMAIDKAKKFGIGSVAVRNSNHFGIAGFYSKMAIDQNMMGMAFTNARPSVAPIFGVQPMFGTNPIAFGAPSDENFPFLYDAATTIVQRGKIEVLNRENKSTPEGWVVDKFGKPNTETKKIMNDFLKQNASLISLGGREEKSGGHKGYGLATIVEILSAALQQGSILHQLSGIDEGKKVSMKVGHFFMAINIEAFTSISKFKQLIGEIIRGLKNSKKEPGKEKIFVAGEKEYLSEIKVRNNGIPINENLQKNIDIMTKKLGIEF